MSMLGRYKKKGGFLQLLNLIETCGPQKQEKFLKMIEEEDPKWAEAIKTKMINMKKVFSWDDNTVAEIVGRLQDLTVATALAGLDEAAREKAFKMIGGPRKRKIDDLMAAKTPTTAEISTVFVQILTEVRQLVEHGYLYLEKIDPTLVVDADIEEKLSSHTLYSMNHDPSSTPASTSVAAQISDLRPGVSQAEVENIKKKMAYIFAENQQLKEKLLHAENKLAQIRKIA